ncbi:MAG: methyltransferase domain-containing protein [Chitinophagaceae bacterium]|jgi:2-polyprenyl-3-methyl-5-hydroxy-6-metoxy-1,4-benzoquinol methylase|nr:methyltransferase domain-containing protein [Chitinophagaceae bacterium]
MAQKEWFDDWFDTPYYHQLYFQRDQQEAARFIAALIAHLDPAAGSRMLDVACGKGRHSIQLHSMGFEVTGIDISVSSIAQANQHAADTLQFYVHDMRQPFWINYFDYAFNFFTSFGYFRTRREHDAAMRSIGQSIKPGGTLVVDYLNTHYAEDHLQHTADVALNGYNYHVTKWMDETHFYKKIEVEHDDFTEPHIYTEKVAKFSLGDFTDMMAYQGLQIREVFGDYNLGAYDTRKTPRMIMLATRIK